MVHDAAIALWSGPAHVLVAANAAFLDRVPAGCMGVPLREAFADPMWRGIQDAMDRAYRTGEVIAYPWGTAEVVIVPIRDGTFRGVATHYAPRIVAAPLPAASRRPSPRSVPDRVTT